MKPTTSVDTSDGIPFVAVPSSASKEAQKCLLHSDSFLKGWYSTERLTNSFRAGSNMSLPVRRPPVSPSGKLSSVVPYDGGTDGYDAGGGDGDGGGAATAGEEDAEIPEAVRPAWEALCKTLPPLTIGTTGEPPPSPVGDRHPQLSMNGGRGEELNPADGNYFIKNMGFLVAQLQEHLDKNFKAQEERLERIEKQQKDIVIQMARGISFAIHPEAGAPSAGDPAGSGKAADSRGHRQSARPSNSRRSLTDVADNIASQLGGRSKGAFVARDAEVHVDGEGPLLRVHRNCVRFIKGKAFDYNMGALIVLNALFLGVQIDIKARALSKDSTFQEPPYFSPIETVFAAIFLLELVLRFYSAPRRFFWSLWNWFDLFVVTLAILEECIKYGIGEDTVAGKVSMFRLLRVCKFARTLRIIRVIRAFRELRIVVMAILYCLRSLLWTLVLLFMVFYVMAILILVELTGVNMHGGPYGGASEDASVRLQFFPNLPRALVTLFQSITGGVEWGPISAALEDIIPYMGVFWVLCIGFVVFAIGNVVTGIFVQQAERVGMDDERNVMMEEKDMRELMVTNMRGLFHKADTHGKGVLTREKLFDVLELPETKRYLWKFDIDHRDVVAYFDLVSSGDQNISLADVDSFIGGCFRLKGPAKNVDLAALTFQHQWFLRENRYDSEKLRHIYRSFNGQLST